MKPQSPLPVPTLARAVFFSGWADVSDIREVVTCRRPKANQYLDAGYRLLAVEQETVWAKPPKGTKGVDGYVLKHLTFCLGRPADVEPFDPDKQPAETDA